MEEVKNGVTVIDADTLLIKDDYCTFYLHRPIPSKMTWFDAMYWVNSKDWSLPDRWQGLTIARYRDEIVKHFGEPRDWWLWTCEEFEFSYDGAWAGAYCVDIYYGNVGDYNKRSTAAVLAVSALEKQKEQKPAERQDYSGLNDLERAIHRGFLSAGVENVSVKIIKETAQDCLAQIDKSAEWSEEYREEDLRMRFAFYTYKDEDSVLYLSNVFVEETSRNKGFGAKILAAAEKVAETLGTIQIRLKVKQNSPANAWYRKHGYGYMAFEDGYDWLEKTLEYMKPYKQEWSEEDENALKYLHELISFGFTEKFFDAQTAADMRVWLNTRLKSLRSDSYKNCNSRWKPSDEHPEGGYSEKPNDLLSEPEADLEKAARNVYESMNNVRRDMVELGKILNARKED